MLLIALKVALAPALVALAAFASHRWGQRTAGWLTGLPLLSAPVSFLLFMQYGAGFARNAAKGTLLGLAAFVVFCAAYVLLARRFAWYAALGGAYLACLSTVALLVEIAPTVAWSLTISLGILLLALVGLGGPRSQAASANAPVGRRVLVGRMAVACVSVATVTTLAGVAGSAVAGVLAPLPIVAPMLAASSHRRGSAEEAADLLRGSLFGVFGALAFFGLIALTMHPTGHPLTTYLVATLAAALVAVLAPRASAVAHAVRAESAGSLSALRSLRHHA